MNSKPKPNLAENADNDGGEKNIQPNKIVTGSFSNSRKNSVPPPPQLVAERVSVASIVDEDSEPEQYMTSEEHQKMLREQDRYLPIANISRIMKRFIPESGKIAKDAKECIQECVSEFVSFITSEASERCHNEKRKTINGEDILWAMQTLGFESYVEPLKIYLSKYRAACKGDKALQEMGLAPDDQDLANLDSMPSVAAHDLSALLAGGNHIVLNSENLGIVSEGGSSDRIVGQQQVGQNLAGSSHHQSTNQQLAFITTSNGGNQQIMYLEPAHFQTNQSGGGQAQFITLNRAPTGVQIVQLVPAGSIANANGQQIITVQTGQQQNE